MRIGEVSKDNYADYIKLLGGKNTENLDKLFGKDENGEPKELTQEECNAISVRAGLALEGTFTTQGDDSWKKIVPVSDDIKDKLTATVKRQFITNGDGKGCTADGDELGAIIQNYIKTISPSERLSVGWTLNQIVHNENVRLTNYVKANDPTWEQGKPFDRNIFNDNYLNVKA
jgi:hypothetical protein